MKLDLFSNASKGVNDFLYFGLGIIVVFIGYFVGQMPLFLMTKLAINNNPDFGVAEYEKFNNELDFSLIGLHSNMGFLLLILMFVFAMLGLFLVLKIQKKNIKDLITPKSNIDFKKILFGFGLWFGIALLFELVLYFVNPGDYTFQFKPLSFIVLMIICLIALPIQTSFEELFFRGYIMQGSTNFYNRKWFGLLISTLFFAFVHGANPEVSEYGAAPMMLYYLMAGAFLGIITIMDDSLELALGVHWATNLFGALFLSYKGSVLQTDTLFKSEAVNPWVMTLFFICTAALFIFITAKKYGWKFDALAQRFGKPNSLKTAGLQTADATILEASNKNETDAYVDFTTTTTPNTNQNKDSNIETDTDYDLLFNDKNDKGEHGEIS